ncbi:Haemolysin XhlA [Acinetobacter baumannii]|nr:Haemolysin XhlA [Acinetobacter baumannii]
MPNHEGGHEVDGNNLDWQRIVLDMSKEFTNFKEDYRDDKKSQKEINEKVDTRLGAVETTALVNTKDIASMQQTLGDIKDDTKWLRRTITGGLITGGIGAFITIVIWLAQT